MPIVNRVAAFADEVADWRRDLHRHPETGFDVQRTAAIVADKLRSFGCDAIITSFARTGVIGIIKGRSTASGAVIGLRADMDALPIRETTGLPHASTVEGKMHACGHDGHTAMLLGAARYLAETRNFDGTAVLIFQPAEEGEGGARLMVSEGLMDRFGIGEVYGMHNWPGIPIGQFAIRKGPLMAAADRFNIRIHGRGAHAAQPHMSIDTVAIGCQLHQALQHIVSRNVDPLDSAVISVAFFHAGTAHNVIPSEAHLGGTVRTLRQETRTIVVKRMQDASTVSAACTARGSSSRYITGAAAPSIMTARPPARWPRRATSSATGQVETEALPTMAGEDFALMLEARPGAMIFIGNGDSAGLHHPAYDFNDGAIATGISYWSRLVETRMPA